jgi:hypothetical protein
MDGTTLNGSPFCDFDAQTSPAGILTHYVAGEAVRLPGSEDNPDFRGDGV